MVDEKASEEHLRIMDGIEALDYKLSILLRVAILALVTSIITAVVVLIQGFPPP